MYFVRYHILQYTTIPLLIKSGKVQVHLLMSTWQRNSAAQNKPSGSNYSRSPTLTDTRQTQTTKNHKALNPQTTAIQDYFTNNCNLPPTPTWRQPQIYLVTSSAMATMSRVTLNRQDQISVFPIIVAAKCYRLVPPIESGPRSLAVWFSIHTWRYGVRIPGGSDTFLNAIGELFSIAVGFRSGKVRVG